MTARPTADAPWAMLLAGVALWTSGCSHPKPPPGPEAEPVQETARSASPAVPAPSASASAASAGPELAATVIAATVYKLPEVGSRKLGYIRLGRRVKRDAAPVEGRGCKGDFYHVVPTGYVCTDEATTDVNDPLVRAAGPGPDLSKPMPYHYGFVRATAPLYLRVPTHAEQEKSEFGLAEHLKWYEDNKLEVQRVELGANDVPLDSRGFPRIGGKLPPGQLLSSELDMDEIFGGSRDEPVPWWLDGGRKVRNVSGYDVPEYAV
ncbi:MAG TPA: L,D-transpeptidase, partial [Polyangiaceae bacterium]|nr:L,D-transpeptidase [Polyangiaceae bacterium]